MAEYALGVNISLASIILETSYPIGTNLSIPREGLGIPW